MSATRLLLNDFPHGVPHFSPPGGFCVETELVVGSVTSKIERDWSIACHSRQHKPDMFGRIPGGREVSGCGGTDVRRVPRPGVARQSGRAWRPGEGRRGPCRARVAYRGPSQQATSCGVCPRTRESWPCGAREVGVGQQSGTGVSVRTGQERRRGRHASHAGGKKSGPSWCIEPGERGSKHHPGTVHRDTRESARFEEGPFRPHGAAGKWGDGTLWSILCHCVHGVGGAEWALCARGRRGTRARWDGLAFFLPAFPRFVRIYLLL